MKAIGSASRRVASRLAIELAKTLVVQVVDAALDLGDLLAQSSEPRRIGADAAQQWDRIFDDSGAVEDRIAHLLHFRRKLAEFEERDRLRSLLHLVDGIVHRGDQVLDVAAVKR